MYFLLDIIFGYVVERILTYLTVCFTVAAGWTAIQHKRTTSFCCAQFYAIHFLRSLRFTDLWHHETGLAV